MKKNWTWSTKAETHILYWLLQ